MSGFVTPKLLLEQMTLPDGESRKVTEWWRLWYVREVISYDTGEGIVTVPTGFITDGASIPRVFQGLFPSLGAYSLASVVHDYLCYRINDGRPLPFCTTRSRAAAIFKGAMRDSKTMSAVAHVFYRAVMLARNLPGTDIVSEVNPSGL